MLFAVAACGRGGARDDSARARPVGSSAGPAPRADSSAGAGSKAAAAPVDSTRRGRQAPDSAVKMAIAARLPGRTRNDSISFVAAIRAGL